MPRAGALVGRGYCGGQRTLNKRIRPCVRVNWGADVTKREGETSSMEPKVGPGRSQVSAWCLAVRFMSQLSSHRRETLTYSSVFDHLR